MDFPLGQCRNATQSAHLDKYQTLIFLPSVPVAWPILHCQAINMQICLKSVWNWTPTWYCFATICIIIMVFLGVSNDFDLRVWLLPQVVLLGSYYGWRCLTFLHCAQCVLEWYSFLPVNLMILICECEYCPRWLCQVIITGGTSWLFSAVCFQIVCYIFAGVFNDFDLRVWLLPKVALPGDYQGWRRLTFLYYVFSNGI